MNGSAPDSARPDVAAGAVAIPLSTTSAASRAAAATDCPTRRPRLAAPCVIPSTQPAKPISTRPAAAASTPDGPASWLSTHSSQTLAPYIGKASAWRSTSIQRPGFGATRHRPGAVASTA